MDPELEPDFAAAEAGFTLIELLVSIAILAVLALGLFGIWCLMVLILYSLKDRR